MLFCCKSRINDVTKNIIKCTVGTLNNLSHILLPVGQVALVRRGVGIGTGVHNLNIISRNGGFITRPTHFICKSKVAYFFRSKATLPNKTLLQHQNVRPVFSNKSLNTSVLDVNTNVIKDVILFRYENPKYYKMLNLFAFCQFFFWVYLSHFAYTTLKDTPIDQNNSEDLPWWRKINLGENKYRNGITVLCFAIGYGILGAAWAFTLKSVRFLVLRKGGASVTFVTYGPFGKNRMTTIPINEVSCQQSRQAARVHLPLKVKSYLLHYMLDMRGEFTNPRLFDHTVGMKRIWTK